VKDSTLDAWEQWLRDHLTVEDPSHAFWILPDGVLIGKGMHDHSDAYLHTGVPLHIQREVAAEFEAQFEGLDDEDSGPGELDPTYVKDWFDSFFEGTFSAVRHATAQFPQQRSSAGPEFSGDLPTPEQASRIAQVVETVRNLREWNVPEATVELRYWFSPNERMLTVEFPTRATGAAVIAKLERALDCKCKRGPTCDCDPGTEGV
jgi:hypothetical protein